MSNAARVTPLGANPEDKRERHSLMMELTELRHRWGPDAILLTSEQAADFAAKGEALHVKLSADLKNWTEARDLARELFG